MQQFQVQPLDTVIVEDNLGACRHLKSCLQEFDYIHLTGEASNGRDAVALIDNQRPDLLFLDIHLPELDGFEVLESIGHKPMVIFVSAYDQYAIHAFDVNGVDYLLKPIRKDRLKAAIRKVIQQKKQVDGEVLAAIRRLSGSAEPPHRFAVKVGKQILIIPEADICFFKAEDKYLFLHTTDGNYFYNSTIKKLAAELDPDKFIQVNRGHIIAIDKILKLKRNYKNAYVVVMDDHQKTGIQVSRHHIAALKSYLNI
ncbi:MAG: response regulator transcription factor [Desulfobacteraceae bacterium]|nr:response regulator transcription factor [Desulfobacteraceae bacterium]